MSKLLITEVFRLQKLMGKSLIVEQFVEVADDVLEFIGKISGRLSDETIELSKKLGKAVTEEEVIEALSKLVKSNKEIANYVIPKIMSTLGDAERKAITDAKLTLQKLIRNKQITPEAARKMGNNWVDKYVVTQFDGITDIIKKEFTDFIETEIIENII
jgi:predicted ATP-dependent Lon-type protease